MKVSVIIPVYNERDTVHEVVERARAVRIEGVEKEIIAVDDGSTDGTRELLRELGEPPGIGVKVVYHPQNRGKGAAIRSGLAHVTGDVVIIQDADLELDPNDYPRLLAPIISGDAQVVYGSRFLSANNMENIPWLIWAANRFLTWFTNILYGSQLTDEATGYKVFLNSVIQSIRLECERFEFCPEVTAKILRSGYRIVEVPVSYHPRTKKQGKKIKWKDGLIAIQTLIRYRFWKPHGV